MSEFLQMDIFFFITTIVVAILGILVALILYRVWRILGNVEHISQDISEESTLLRADIAGMRSSVRVEGFKFRYMKTFFTSAFKRFTNKKEQ